MSPAPPPSPGAPRRDFDAALARWAAERATAEGGAHRDLDAWIGYVSGTTTDAERTALEEHLALCPHCVRLVRELRSFAGGAVEPSPEVAPPSELERAAAWRALRAELAPRGIPLPLPSPALMREPSSSPSPGAAPGRSRSAFRLPRSLAASFVVGALALGVWGAVLQRRVVELRHEVTTLREPQKNVPIYDLYPDAATRGPEAGTTELARGVAPTATVILNVIGEQDYEDFAVELVGADETVLWSERGFMPDPDFGTFTLGLPLADLGEGRYRVRLYGLRGESRTLIEDYPLAIR